ncbi:winged helix-turn-helix transcriptional regulator [Pseudomonas chlororaphis]|uniref:winged helix-turn-helix transcriptional regulator n=1 Tax=Pseudomonas chlororaphis TaxID=587753 RepID=UPI000F587DFD|nr:helix-turn-helix domain-containing protein [Pseudomonas chlororaphis]
MSSAIFGPTGSKPDADSCKELGKILDRIADKWAVLVVGILSDGPMRFSAIQRGLSGISHRMLTLTLRGLERDGLLTRTAYATAPPRVDYELTDLGHSLMPSLEMLLAWVGANQATIEHAREKFDKDTQAAVHITP